MAKTGTGDKIRQVRERKGLSQRELAKRSGISSSHLSKIESGVQPENGISPRLLERVAKALGLSVATLRADPGYDDFAKDFAKLSKRDQGAIIKFLALPEDHYKKKAIRDLLDEFEKGEKK